MRHAHNFKGGAMMLSLAEAAEAAHALESCLLSQECEGVGGAIPTAGRGTARLPGSGGPASVGTGQMM